MCALSGAIENYAITEFRVANALPKAYAQFFTGPDSAALAGTAG